MASHGEPESSSTPSTDDAGRENDAKRRELARVQRETDAELDLERYGKEIESIASIVRHASGLASRSINTWPGGVLSAIGVAILGTTYILELLDASRIGATEFSVSMLVGLILTIVGPVVITRNAHKSEELLETGVTAYELWRARHTNDLMKMAEGPGQ